MSELRAANGMRRRSRAWIAALAAAVGLSGSGCFYNAAVEYATRPPDHAYVDAVRGVAGAWTDGTRLVVELRGRVIHQWRASHVFSPHTWDHPLPYEESLDPLEGRWFTIDTTIPEVPDLAPVLMPRAARSDGRPDRALVEALFPVVVVDLRDAPPFVAFAAIQAEARSRDMTLFLLHHRYPDRAAGDPVWSPPPDTLRPSTGDPEVDWAIDREWDLWWLVSKYPGNAAFLVSMCPEAGAEPLYYMMVLDREPYVAPPWRVVLIPFAVLFDVATFPLQMLSSGGIGFAVG